MHEGVDLQHVAQDDLVRQIRNLILDLRHFASLGRINIKALVQPATSSLTYTPAIRPMNTVLRHAIAAVMRFLAEFHSLAIGWRLW